MAGPHLWVEVSTTTPVPECEVYTAPDTTCGVGRWTGEQVDR